MDVNIIPYGGSVSIIFTIILTLSNQSFNIIFNFHSRFSHFLVVQKPRMKLTGRYIEKLGYWRPRNKKTYDRSIVLNFHKVRYWLGNGAKPTKPVKRLLSKFDFWPQVPPPQGSKYLYDRPEKEYSQHAMDILHKVHNMDRDTPLKEKIKAEIHKMETLNSFERSMYSKVDIE